MHTSTQLNGKHTCTQLNCIHTSTQLNSKKHTYTQLTDMHNYTQLNIMEYAHFYTPNLSSTQLIGTHTSELPIISILLQNEIQFSTQLNGIQKSFFLLQTYFLIQVYSSVQYSSEVNL